MPAKSLNYFDYLKAAFHRRWPVPGLGPLPVNYMALGAFGVLSLANPGFLFIGAAAELIYLFSLASNQRFQKVLQGEALQDKQQSWEAEIEAALARLSTASQARFSYLLTQCRQILGIGEAMGDRDLMGMSQMRTGGLNQLLWIFLRLLASREVLEQNLSRVDPAALEKEVQQLEKRLEKAEEGSALARSLGGSLDILTKRLENLERAKESMTVIDAEIERIQHQVVLIREESAVTGKAEILSSRLDAVSGALADTNRWMEQNATIFGELGADPLGSTPRNLPTLPHAADET